MMDEVAFRYRPVCGLPDHAGAQPPDIRFSNFHESAMLIGAPEKSYAHRADRIMDGWFMAGLKFGGWRKVDALHTGVPCGVARLEGVFWLEPKPKFIPLHRLRSECAIAFPTAGFSALTLTGDNFENGAAMGAGLGDTASFAHGLTLPQCRVWINGAGVA